MLNGLRYLLWLIGRGLLALRYRIQVQGLEQVQALKGKCVVIPNHPGYMDPTILLIVLWPYLRPRPMLYEENFKNPFLWPIMKILNAVQVPDLEQASAQARERAKEAVGNVIEGLQKGENHILWPAGHIQRDGVERLGGARAIADILEAVPDASVMLVRTRGLWGSMFGFAQTGARPQLIKLLFKSAGYLLGNVLFFMPRRSVTITIEVPDRKAMPEPRREVLNPWLEAWYNQGGPEDPSYVPYHFYFGARTFQFPEAILVHPVDLSKIKEETKVEIAHLVEQKLNRPLTEAEKAPETTFDQLGLDSLDRMDLTLKVEQRFGFSSDQSPVNLGQLWALAQGLIEKGPPRPAPPEWFAPLSRDGLLTVEGDTLPAAFVTCALKHRREVVVADDLAGALTYERLLVVVVALSKRLRQLPEPNVGLLLPASVAGDLLFFALHLAGKLPVVLNWTTGPKNLAHAAEVMGLKHVVTSRAFVDRTLIEVAGTQYLYLEELRKEIGKLELLITLAQVRYFPGRIQHLVPALDPHQPAVVLFTSGSEKAPKAVPLTHQNILSDQRLGIPVMGLNHKDVILGFLPAFHSFGLTVTGLLPLLTGMRVVHHPDPTDASGLARKIAAYKPTLLVGTPTFVSYIVERASKGDLDSLRMIVVGAEKCPRQLVERCRALVPHAVMVEGYGITECAPVVAVNPPSAPREGTVGKALPGIEVIAIDLETEKRLPAGQMGMLLVHGPTVFPGYLGGETSNPFLELEGKRWYVTGDLGEIDADGYIWFRGRLKRFLKAGGEMISLPALEEPFARLYPPTEKGPRVAVEGIETPGGGRKVILFTTEPIELLEANAHLVEAGFHGVMRLDEVRRVASIPILGTGKTDYKVLRAEIAAEFAHMHT